jgi:hypothetical protein
MIDGTNKFGQYVDHEKRLLEDQKNLVNDAALAKSRQVALNESVRKRTQDYSYLMMVVCIFLGVLLLLAFLKPSLTFIPSIIFDLLIVIVVASAVIYVIFAIQKIRARDRIDYDTLDLPSPAIDPADAAGANNNNNGSGSGSGDQCYARAEGCCGSGTMYDPTTGTCVPAPTTPPPTATTTTPTTTTPTGSVSAMTTMGEARVDIVKPYSPTETSQYAFL